MSTKDYDPKKVTLSLGGHIAEGFADGTFITVSRNNPTWTHKSGASGESARGKSNDFSGTIELSLMQTSKTNDFLSAKMVLDESNLNAGKFPVGIIDANGTTVITGVEAWVTQPPSTEWGKEIGDRVWTIEVGELLMFVGGTD